MKKLNEYTQEELGVILDNIEKHRSYYVGGSLCIDKLLPDGDVMNFNLTDHVCAFVSGESLPTSPETMKKVFDVYLKHKGRTDYYDDAYAKYIEKKEDHRLRRMIEPLSDFSNRELDEIETLLPFDDYFDQEQYEYSGNFILSNHATERDEKVENHMCCGIVKKDIKLSNGMDVYFAFDYGH